MILIVWAFGLVALAQESRTLQDLVAAKRFTEASAIVQRKLRSNPRDPEALYWKAVLELSSGQEQRALDTLHEVESMGLSKPPHWLLQARIEETRNNQNGALEAYRSLCRAYPTPENRFLVGLAEFRTRQYAAAVATLGALVGKTGDEGRLQHVLGLAFLGQNDLKAALEHLEQSSKISPNAAAVRYDLGLALLQTGRLEDAVGQFRDATRLKPDWAEAYLYLGRALHDLNLSDDALDAFRKAERFNPKVPLLHHHFGLLHKGRGEYDEAVSEFEKEIASGSNYPPSYYHLAEILYNRQAVQRSRELIARAIELDPQKADYHLLSAKMALAAGELEEASRQVEAALSLDLSLGAAHYLKGRILQAKGMTEEAKASFEVARRLADARSQRGREP